MRKSSFEEYAGMISLTIFYFDYLVCSAIEENSGDLAPIKKKEMPEDFSALDQIFTVNQIDGECIRIKLPLKEMSYNFTYVLECSQFLFNTGTVNYGCSNLAKLSLKKLYF